MAVASICSKGFCGHPAQAKRGEKGCCGNERSTIIWWCEVLSLPLQPQMIYDKT